MSEVPTGWVCPECKRVWSPRVDMCTGCLPAHHSEPHRLELATVRFIALRLPDEMADPRYRRVARLIPDWREVLPGLQARVAGNGIVQADVDFRLTPHGDSPQHD